MIYWRHVELELKQMGEIFQKQTIDLAHQTDGDHYIEVNDERNHLKIRHQQQQFYPVNIATYLVDYKQQQATNLMISNYERNNLDRRAYELQSIVCDFFDQLKQADIFMSITIAFAFLI